MKFNGVDPRTLHPGISIAKEIPPGTVTSQLETLSGSTGEIIAGRTIQQGEYIVRINIAGKYRAQGWEIRKLLAGWARSADIVTHELIPTHWPTVAYDAILKEISPPEFTFGFTTIDVVFALPRPIAHDLVSKMTLMETNVITHEITIGGTSHAHPSITVDTTEVGAAESVIVYADGEPCIGIKGPFTAGGTLLISCDPPRVREFVVGEGYSDINDRIMYDATNFQKFAQTFTPGEHTVTVEPCGGISVSWKDEWL